MMQPNELSLVAQELHQLKEWENQQESQWYQHPRKSPMKHYCRFPPSCLRLLRGIEGNLRCADCNASNPQWATISYGALLCIDCSGRHRQLGVQVSTVRSISMDSWSHFEILCMLEGGNKQLNDFFHRHGLPQEYEDDLQKNRYKTNAAMFYRVNLAQHVRRVEEGGMYRGRENSRRSKASSSSSSRGEGRRVGRNAESGDEGSATSCAAECGMVGKEGSSDGASTVGA